MNDAFEQMKKEMNPNPIKVLSAHAYIQRRFNPQEWIVRGVVPAATPEVGATVERGLVGDCIARSKCGKSWLAIRLAICAATGIEIDGSEVPRSRKRRVVYVNMELPPNVMKYRLERVCRQLGVYPAEGELDNLDIVDKPTPEQLRNAAALDDTSASWLTDNFRDICTGADLVIVDPLYKLILPEEDENLAKDMAHLVAWRDEIAKLGPTVLTVHHERKRNGAGEREITDAGSGSGVLGRDYDFRIVLDSPSDDSAMRKIRYSLRSEKPRAVDYAEMDPAGGLTFADPLDEGEYRRFEAAYKAGAKRSDCEAAPDGVKPFQKGGKPDLAKRYGVE